MQIPKTLLGAISAAAVASLLTSNANAIVLGNNVTISDKNSSGLGWYGDHEDNETETNPNTINAQVWDLEGMFLDGTKLTLVGGFDFKNGTQHGGYTWKGGDLFIDIGGNSAVYGQAANGGSGATLFGQALNLPAGQLFGYDYVLDIGSFSDGGAFGYDIVQLGASSVLTRGADVAASNPWNLANGSANPSSFFGSYGVLSAADVALYGLLGDGSNDTHYFMTFDLASVPGIFGADPNIFHYTIECGNDDLMGKAKLAAPRIPTVPDTGSTMLLLGASTLGLEAFRRKFLAGN